MPPEHNIPINIDHKPRKAPKTPMTGAEIKALAEPPIGADRDLFRVVPGPADDVKVADTDSVDLSPGMHFYSAPTTINPGAMRLPEEDEAYLEDKGYHWQLLPDGSGGYLVISDYAVAPERYDRGATDLMIRIPDMYNMAGLDMYYVDPPLLLKSGGYPNAAASFETHCGRNWQRFSRHLVSPWRAGIDRLPSFLPLIHRELQGKD